MDNAGLIIGWVVTGLSALGALATTYATKKRATADTESVSVTTMKAVIEELRTEIDRLKQKNAELHAELSAVQSENEAHELRLEGLEGEGQKWRMTCAAFEQRIKKLEGWIRVNTGQNPDDINGHPV